MNTFFFLPLSLVLGLLLGNLYFRGLWVTVQKLPAAQRPISLILGSFFARLGISIAGFFLIIAITKEYALFHLLVCLSAFIGERNRIVKKVQQKLPRSLNAY